MPQDDEELKREVARHPRLKSIEPIIGHLPIDLTGPQHGIWEMRDIGTIGHILRLETKPAIGLQFLAAEPCDGNA